MRSFAPLRREGANFPLVTEPHGLRDERYRFPNHRYDFVGFITHEAAQRYDRGHRDESLRPQALSHGDNLNRLARALRTVDAANRTRTEELVPFTGGGSDVARMTETFETPYGTIHVTTYPVDYDRGSSGPLSDRARIAINISSERLRAYVASGRFDDLDHLLQIVELFEHLASQSDSPNPRGLDSVPSRCRLHRTGRLLSGTGGLVRYGT
ncbi:hypothetical protein [Nocardia sp. NPDC050710]|uniref:hypothetical protein n=1 Tax=Nocardia sp. NPDC050710 TaxID=3157220 RepID=UPI00340DE0FC